MTNILDLIGRIFISAIFLLSGFNKIGNYEGTVGWMESFGLPGFLLIPAIILEIVAPLVRDTLKDNKKCGGRKVFSLEDSNAQELNCRNECSIRENCVAVAGVWGQMCFGCNGPSRSAT